MPLALVLAAGWLELLTFEEVAGEIAASLDILESQARDMPDRQRSVRAAFDYSWQRLSTEERQAFSRLAVFRGGFSRRAARQVAGAGLRTLRTLVEKSLITAEGSDRYAVHELLRQFAEEKLEAAGQAGPIRDAHSRYYLEAAAQREADLKGRRQLEALEEVGADLDNVRAAWVWALERRDERAIDQVLESLSLFFYMRSRYQEGWALFQQALQRRVIDHPQLGDSHRVWGRLTARSGLLQSQFAESDPAIEEAIKMSLAIAEANVDQAEIAYSYLALGHYHSRVTGNHQQALNYFEQCLEYYQTLGDLYYVARSLHRVGYSHSHVTGLEEFNHCTRKSLQLARQIGDLSDVAGTLSNLGASSILAGDYVEADGILREAIALSQQIGSRSGLAQSFALLSLHQFVSGKLEEAQETAAKGVAIAKDIAFPLTQAWGLAVLSMRASLDNDYELGRRLAEESLLFITNNNLGVFLGHWAQATAGVGLGQTEQAWQQMLAALEISYRFRWFATMTWPLPAAGIILVQQGHPRRAAEILGLYFNHPRKPSGWAEKWSLLNEWQAQLQESLGVDRYRLAWERGKALDLVTAVEMLLAGGEEAP
jgi:tetratricopeptide (TPR) repeat protein